MKDGRKGTPHRRKHHHIVGLDCNHVLIFYTLRHCPTMNALVWCFRCDAQSQVTVTPNHAEPEPESMETDEDSQIALDLGEIIL